MKRWRIPTNVSALGVVMMVGQRDCDPNATSQPATIEHQLIVVSGGNQYGTANSPLARNLVVRYEERTVRGSSA